MPSDDDLEVLEYPDFAVGVRWLAEELVRDGWIPDVVVAVMRGGLFVAAGLAYALDLKDVRTINVEFYTGTGVTLGEPRMVGPAPDLGDLTRRRVLVADDVTDTGATLRFVEHLLPSDADVRTAVLYAKPHSEATADFAWRSTERWIRFPWIQVPSLLD